MLIPRFRYEDPNQHLKDFLKIMDSLDLDGENRERTGLRITTDTRPSSTHIPQAYAEAVYSNPHPQNQNEPPKQNPFTFCIRVGPNPKPQALGTTFEARVWDYMATHTERMDRFENSIFKQREEINDRMTEMFRILKELTTIRAPEKVLIREEAKFPVAKKVNSISLTKGEEERSEKTDVTTGDNFEKHTKTEMEMPVKEAEKEDEAENEPNKKAGKEEITGAPSSQPVKYYWKHRINEKLIEGLVGNHRFHDSLSGAQVRKIKGKTYNLSPRGPVYEAILRKKITRKEDIGGNFELPCNIGGLKHMNALVDQGSDVNVMPLSTYVKLTDERPTEMNIRLSLASHSYIYPLGITEDVLVEVAEHVYPVDFVILDIKEDEKRPFILGTPFLTTAKAVINFDKGTGLERSSPGMGRKKKLHLEREMEFNQWKSKNFKGKHPALVKFEGGIDDEIEIYAGEFPSVFEVIFDEKKPESSYEISGR
ncbi:MAK10-like protein [Tanacetum coccineum]